MSGTLAMLGGPKAVPAGLDGGPWPVIEAEDEAAVLRALRGGRLTATAAGETEVAGLEQEWANFVGVAHCAGVGSGTTALWVALTALGVGAGDEVVVPALTMNATAHAVRLSGATPVFADIEPDTFTVDPAQVRAAIGPRTAALLPVHLHGLPADMGALVRIAVEGGRNLPVVEDAAQSHGATYRGAVTGSIGTLGCFSLHPSKNLPTCGEGGLITTDSAELRAAVEMQRNFGERPPTTTRDYVAYQPGTNGRLSPLQAAFTRAQLRRFPAYAQTRAEAVGELLGRLAALPGLGAPFVPGDRTHAWHILRFRIRPEELGLADVPLAALRAALHRALRAEGVPVSQYQAAPLPAHPAFRAPGRSLAQIAADYPVACATIDGSLCLQRRHLGPAAGPALAAYADGFEKVWAHMDVIRQMARSRAAAPGWRDAVNEG
ncbi:MAG TPA: DegT/DnrJ/EryC1/StrS family aminotransferase [Actinocrinis sp.]|nr:DegT/DnrJ/EryC1/StrS family aminotransferase [Actinocrinis sp.]